MCAEISKELLLIGFFCWLHWSNHYFCVPLHPLHLNAFSLASVCQVLVKNSVLSDPLRHIRIITCHQIWWQESKRCVTLHRGFEKSCRWINAPLNLLQPPSATYPRPLWWRISAVVDMVVADCSKSLGLCSLCPSSRISVGNIHIEPQKNQRVFTTSTANSYYGKPLHYNGILMPALHQHLHKPGIRFPIDEIKSVKMAFIRWICRPLSLRHWPILSISNIQVVYFK